MLQLAIVVAILGSKYWLISTGIMLMQPDKKL